MKPKIKTILTGILIGIIAFPTITLGGTFASSLIQGKTVTEAVQILSGQIDSLIGRVGALEAQQSKEEACRKASELKIASQETKIGYYTKQSNKPIRAYWSPDTTEALLEYLHGYMQNYEKTGVHDYLHIPDYDPELVKEYIPILEARWQEYLIQKELCGQL
jgi:hypothetical protein